MNPAARSGNRNRTSRDAGWPFRPGLAALGGLLGGLAVLYACENATEPPALEPTNTTASSAAALGAWSDTFNTQIVALHASLVPLAAGGIGVLAWGHAGVPHLWDLANSTPTFTPIGEPVELFCVGMTFLPDGSLLAVGGHDEVKGNGYGIKAAYRFVQGAWLEEPSMSFARWYPTATTLENGDVVVYAGTDNEKVKVPWSERYSYASRTWTTHAAKRAFPWYPRSFLDPKSGKVYYAGESQQTRWLDPNANGGLGKWTLGPLRWVADRNYGSAVMYEQGKILYAGGGGQNKSRGIPPTNTAEIIDLNQANPQWTFTGSMAYDRRQTNLTILADGKVLLTGGTSSLGFSNRTLARREPELWDPATGTWTLLAPEEKVRLYHATALLLPDGRVVSAGSGDGANVRSERNGQIFSPPYLFNANGDLAPRPQITAVSTTTLGYGQTFSITTPEAASIAKVHLIRFSAVTHAFDQSQMLYRASFTAGSGTLEVTGPTSGRVAPPGPYLLFIVDANGVPSEAKVLLLAP